MNIQGISFEAEALYPIQVDFRRDLIPIAAGRLFIEGDVIKCEASLPEECLQMYPYLGLRDVTPGMEEGQKIIHTGMVMSLGIGAEPNEDPAIKTIAEQIKS